MQMVLFDLDPRRFVAAVTRLSKGYGLRWSNSLSHSLPPGPESKYPPAEPGA